MASEFWNALTVTRFIRWFIATCLTSVSPDVPEPVQAELKGLYLANALRNQLLAEELARLLGLLE